MRLALPPAAPSPSDRLTQDALVLGTIVVGIFVVAALASLVVARVRRARETALLNHLAGGTSMTGDVSLASEGFWDTTPVAGPAPRAQAVPAVERRTRAARPSGTPGAPTMQPATPAPAPAPPVRPAPAPGRPPIAAQPAPPIAPPPIPAAAPLTGDPSSEQPAFTYREAPAPADVTFD